jgi:hypothetical protein
MTTTNIPDYYKEAKKIAFNLKAKGHHREAKEIEESIKFNSTSTEILMALSFLLKHVSGNSSIDPGTRHSAKLLRSEIEVALK